MYLVNNNNELLQEMIESNMQTCNQIYTQIDRTPKEKSDADFMLVKSFNTLVEVNQKALDLAGIGVNTKIKGGSIIKENGKLTGVLVDAPMKLISNILPNMQRFQGLQHISKYSNLSSAGFSKR